MIVNGFERFIGIQLRAKLPESNIKPARFMECARWLANTTGSLATTAFFMASDTPSSKELAREYFGNGLFYFNVSGNGKQTSSRVQI